MPRVEASVFLAQIVLEILLAPNPTRPRRVSRDLAPSAHFCLSPDIGIWSAVNRARLSRHQLTCHLLDDTSGVCSAVDFPKNPRCFSSRPVSNAVCLAGIHANRNLR